MTPASCSARQLHLSGCQRAIAAPKRRGDFRKDARAGGVDFGDAPDVEDNRAGVVRLSTSRLNISALPKNSGPCSSRTRIDAPLRSRRAISSGVRARRVYRLQSW